MTHRDPLEEIRLQRLLHEESINNKNEKIEDPLSYQIFLAILYCLMWTAIVGFPAWRIISTVQEWETRPDKAQILNEHDRTMQELQWSPSESLPENMDAHADVREFALFLRGLIYDCSKEQIARSYQAIEIRDVKLKTMISVMACYGQIERSVHHNSQAVRYIRWVAGKIYQEHKLLAKTALEKDWRQLPPMKPPECAMDILTEYFSTEKEKIKLGSVSAGTKITIGHLGVGGQGSATFAQETVIGIGVWECPEMGWRREGSNKSITLGPDGVSDFIKFLGN